MEIPEDIRQRMYDYTKSYDSFSKKSYMTKVACENFLKYNNREDMMSKMRGWDIKSLNDFLKIILDIDDAIDIKALHDATIR